MVAVLFALAVLGISTLAPLQARADTLAVTVADDSVSLEAVDVLLTDVLVTIGEKARARVLIESILTGDLGKARISTSFTRLPMNDALRRLLQGRNFVLLYGAAGVDEIRVYVDGKTGFSELNRSKPGGDAAAGPKARAAQQKVSPSPAPQKAPDDAAKVARLRQAALSSPDAAARVEALQELGDIEDAALVTETLVQALGRERDSTVLETLLEVVGQRQDAIPSSALRAFATSDRDGAARVQALEMLVEQAGSDQATRVMLTTLSKNDASPAVREAAAGLLEDLQAPPVAARPQNPTTMRPPGAALPRR